MRGWMLLAAIVLAAAGPAGAAAVPAQPGADQADEAGALAAFEAAVAEIRATVLRAGERVENWDRGGADPDADARALGAETHFLLTSGRDGAGVSILTDRPLADFAPASWRVVDSYGAAGESLAGAQLAFEALSARYTIGARARIWRQNDVSCWRGFSHALLYEVPGAPAGPDDEQLPTLFRMLILALENETLCMRADGDRERGYAVRYFLPDGRSLTEFDDPTERVTIVPAAPVDRLLTPPPPRPSADPPPVEG